MIYLICYDIEIDRVRTRLAGKLEDFGLERIQKSVFVGELTESLKNKLDIFIEKMEKSYDKTKTFSIIAIPLAMNQIDRTECWGKHPPDWNVILGIASTIIL